MTDNSNETWFRDFVTGELHYLRESLDELKGRKEPVLECPVHRSELDHLAEIAKAHTKEIESFKRVQNRVIGVLGTLQVVWVIVSHFWK